MEHWLQAEAELRRESLNHQTGSNIDSNDNAMLKVPDSLKGEDSSRKRGGGAARRAR